MVEVMKKKERVRAALRGTEIDRAPISMYGHDFLREWTPKGLVEATLELYREHDWDFIKLNPRGSHFPEAWGNIYEPPVSQKSPLIVSHIVQNPVDLLKLRPVNAHRGVLNDSLNALELLVAQVGDEVDIVTNVLSPLSVVGLLCGSPGALIEYSKSDPDSVHSALSSISTTLKEYAKACIEIGAAGIFFVPLSWLSRDTCDETYYREYGRPYDLQVLACVQDAEFNILHICKDRIMIDLLLDYPVHAFNWADYGFGNPSLSEVKKMTNKAIMGGVDHDRLTDMSETEAAEHIDSVLALGSDRLIISGGCAISPLTPDGNRAAVVSRVRGSG